MELIRDSGIIHTWTDTPRWKSSQSTGCDIGERDAGVNGRRRGSIRTD